MISNKLVELIRTHTENLSEQWAKSVKESDHMKTYKKLSVTELSKRNQRFFENLVTWLEKGASSEEITTYFARIGRERYHEGMPLDEINYGIIMAKRALWDMILSEGIFSNAAEVYQALELIALVYNFFDFGFFYIGKEYNEEMFKKAQSIKGVQAKDIVPYFTGPTDEELEKMFGFKMSMK